MFNGDRVSVVQEETVLDTGGDGCAVGMHLMSQGHTLKNG